MPSFRTIMIGSAALAAAFALLLLASPGVPAGVFDLALGSAGGLAARLWGVELLGVAFVCWLLRDLTATGPRKALLLAFVLADLAGVAVTLTAELSGAIPERGWLAVAAYVLLALVYGYFWRRSS